MRTYKNKGRNNIVLNSGHSRKGECTKPGDLVAPERLNTELKDRSQCNGVL